MVGDGMLLRVFSYVLASLCYLLMFIGYTY